MTSEGLVTFPTEIGKDVINLRKIAERIALHPGDVHLSMEDHGGSFSLPVFDPLFLSKFPDLILQEFVLLVEMAQSADKEV